MTKTTILTPAQFTASRKLARTFDHLWGSVPDGTYAIDEINKYSNTLYEVGDICGIENPTGEIIDDESVVIHKTGRGRLHWQVYPNGNVILNVYRPSEEALFYRKIRDAIKPTFSQGIADIMLASNLNPDGWLVAKAVIQNEDQEIFRPTIDDVIIYTCESTLAEHDHYKIAPLLRQNFKYDESGYISHEKMFERHVRALMRPLVGLLIEEDERQEEDEWQENPIVEKIRELMNPLFAIALPDPVNPEKLKHNSREVEKTQITHWVQQHREDGRSTWQKVVHVLSDGSTESFPVESERTATYAVLLLRAQPERTIVDAVHEAIQMQAYRPEDI